MTFLAPTAQNIAQIMTIELTRPFLIHKSAYFEGQSVVEKFMYKLQNFHFSPLLENFSIWEVPMVWHGERFQTFNLVPHDPLGPTPSGPREPPKCLIVLYN